MSRIADFKNMLAEHRVGFRMNEVMSGWHEFEPELGGTRQPFEFDIIWGPRDLVAWANPVHPEFLVQPLSGTVTAGGLCHQTPCEGSLEFRYFKDRSVRYTFDFEVADVRYQYQGSKLDLLPWNLHITHTTAFGTIKEVDSGRLVSRSVVHFKLHRAPSFLFSLRLA
ncbi:MAG: hypothetical protein AUK47_25610 [Deltaproteobacteria bacterium CG2_30_63_29]|nr:MAG: hypothetical protein AUK47_25610 [Deltaproteobacteria bacterium CG2_30_63_29]PJB33540.1 MAG: hypothetical protein CO108_30675 [Deltaproteobacteria bacterium CG_4_9_14_3_um_filter_63_12]